MSSLSIAQQQIVEIAKALSRNARLLILDEPTAALAKKECEELYNIIDKLRSDGVSMIFITHKFEDLYRVADRVTVFRDSMYIGTWGVNEISNSDLIKAMVGREISNLYPEKTAEIREEVLRVENLSSEGYFKDISFDVKKGEVFAITGLVGAGRTELCSSIYGIIPSDSGKIFLDGKEVKIKSPSDALKLGIGYLPEDRLLQGLVGELPIYVNVSASVIQKFVHNGILSQKEEKKNAFSLGELVKLKADGIDAPPISLSGGNQQKVVFAKMLSCDLKVLMLDEPTKGVDIGAKNSIYNIINYLAEKGYAIIIVSSQMPEVLGMADRGVVMSSGRITYRFNKDDVTQEKILSASLIKKDKGEVGRI